VTDSRGMDRRRFLRTAGTVAWATPVVLTVFSSRAGAQSPSLCGPVTVICDNNPPCTSSLFPVCRTDPALASGQCGCFLF
jgi:hypothetical protein